MIDQAVTQALIDEAERILDEHHRLLAPEVTVNDEALRIDQPERFEWQPLLWALPLWGVTMAVAYAVVRVAVTLVQWWLLWLVWG